VTEGSEEVLAVKARVLPVTAVFVEAEEAMEAEEVVNFTSRAYATFAARWDTWSKRALSSKLKSRRRKQREQLERRCSLAQPLAALTRV